MKILTSKHFIVVICLIIVRVSFPYCEAKAWKQPQSPILLTIEATPSFIQTIPEKSLVMFERELFSGPDSLLNLHIPIRFDRNYYEARVENPWTYSYLRIPFLIENWPTSMLVVPGQKIEIKINTVSDYIVSSSHQDLIACQLELYKIINAGRAGSQSGNDPGLIAMIQQRKVTILNQIGQTISGYQNKIPANLLTILKTNYESELGIAYLNNLAALSIYGANIDKELRAHAIRHSLQLYTKEIPHTDTSLIRNSINYATYLFELEQLRNGIESSTKNLRSERAIRTFASICFRYDGFLREKILLNYFRRSLAASDQAKLFLTANLPFFKDSLYRKVLLTLEQAGSGKPAYPFVMEDESGKVYRLSDFKNKVLVCKFWFRGCSGCIGLHQEMKPILEKFSGVKDVVFISISVDKNRQDWIKGMGDGKYTSNEYLNLYIGEQSKLHPMISFYKYFGFPQLLIVGPDGKIINANPEKPYTEVARRKLEELILDAIP